MAIVTTAHLNFRGDAHGSAYWMERALPARSGDA
jgi:hypothetical protein